MDFITDRTQADIDYVKEISAKLKAGTATTEETEAWNAGLKGAYNYTDLNRVEAATAELAAELCLTLNTKTDWTTEDVPTNSDMERYLANIRIIRNAVWEFESTPPLPADMRRLNYVKANNIEKVISDLYAVIASIYRCNELYCGEV